MLDTNVIVAAGIRTDGVPAKLMRNWVLARRLQIVCSPFVSTEYREVTRREKFRRYEFPPLWLEFVIEESLFLAEPAPWPIVSPGAKDAPFLALAKRSGGLGWLLGARSIFRRMFVPGCA